MSTSCKWTPVSWGSQAIWLNIFKYINTFDINNPDNLWLGTHCVKSVKIRSFFSGPCFPVFGLNTGKYGPEKTPYLNTFHTVTTIYSKVNIANKLIKTIIVKNGSSENWITKYGRVHWPVSWEDKMIVIDMFERLRKISNSKLPEVYEKEKVDKQRLETTNFTKQVRDRLQILLLILSEFKQSN